MVSFALACGKYDEYVNHYSFQVNLVFFKNDFCQEVLWLSSKMEYFHNTMPFTVGMFILYVVYFMAKSSYDQFNNQSEEAEYLFNKSEVTSSNAFNFINKKKFSMTDLTNKNKPNLISVTNYSETTAINEFANDER